MNCDRLNLLAGLLALGCATEEASAKGGPAGQVAGGGARCPGPFFADPAATAVTFVGMSATVVDETGAPVPDLRAQACGIDLCLNGATGPSGYVAIEKPVTFLKPAFKYGDGRTHAKLALPLTGTPVDVDLGEQATVTFPPVDTSVPFTPGTDITQNGITLLLQGDLVPVKPDPFDYDTADLRGFRAATFPDGLLPDAVDPSLGLGIVVALTPVGVRLCPRAGLTVPNTAGWPANASVEFFVHGVEVEEEWAPYGGWAKVSDGRVSSDGASITTSEDGGIPELSIVGLRRSP
jgi:hypothetical protein